MLRVANGFPDGALLLCLSERMGNVCSHDQKGRKSEQIHLDVFSRSVSTSLCDFTS